MYFGALYAMVFVFNYSTAKALRQNASQISASKRLADDLISKYGPTGVRPRVKHDDVVNVESYFKLHMLSAFDDQNQRLSFSGELYMGWVDEFLTWEPEDYDGVDVISLRWGDIWIPDITNNDRTDVGTITVNLFEPYVVVNSTGFVVLAILSHMTVYCRLDMSKFPFDVQTCPMRYSSFTYANDQVILSYANTSFSNENEFSFNGVWNLRSFSAREVDVLYKCCPNPFVEIHYEFVLERIVNFYIFIIWIPCGLLSVLELTVFLVHPNSGEKVSLSAANLLAFILFLQIVVDSMPKTGDESPAIVVYFSAMIAISCGSMLASAIVLRVYHHNPSKPVPSFLRCLIFRKKSLISNKYNQSGEDPSPLITASVNEMAHDQGNKQVQPIPANDAFENTNQRQEQTEQNESPRHHSVRSFKQNISKDTLEQNAAEWMELAMTLDKLFLISAMAAMLVTLIYYILRILYQ